MKTARHLRRLIKNESAQALVETMIVYPVVIFFMLGVIQLTLMHQARLMLEYAAFNAARTGAVWNADKDKMRRALALSLIATRPSWPGINGGPIKLGAIDNFGELAIAGAQQMLINEIAGEILDLVGLPYLMNIDILNPKYEDFGDSPEIDFDVASDSFETRRLGQLTIRAKYFYELFIPFANWIIWNGWLELRAKQSLGDANFVIWLENQIMGDDAITHSSRSPFLAFNARNHSNWENGLGILFSAMNDELDSCGKFEGMRRLEFGAIQFAAKSLKKYYIPLVTSHTIRMQSNLYKSSFESDPECGWL
jgi:hypothetical protein